MKKIFFLLIIVLFQSCQKKTINVIIDNPTNNKIEFIIGENEIVIEPKTEINYKLPEGNNTLKINNEIKQFTLSSIKDKNCLINPTQSIYVLSEALYQLEGEDIDIKKLINMRKIINNKRGKYNKLILLDTVDIAGAEIIGFYEKKTDLIIKKNWDFGINEKIPKKLKQSYMNASNDSSRKLTNMVNGYPGKIKIYRAVDLLRELLNKHNRTKANTVYN